MIIRQITVNELMKFDTPVQIADLDHQLNIIAGPNEMGKSTILSALRAAFFSRHRSTAADIRKLQNSHNLGAPTVEIDFELDRKSYQIRKRFLKKPMAKLGLPDGRTYRGDEAEEELLKILTFGKAHDSSSQSSEMWNLFWVEQGKSFTPINVSVDARSLLHSVLESQVGAVLGGKRGRELPTVFSNQLHEYLTPTGRKRGRFKSLDEDVEALSREIVTLTTKREEFCELLDQLERCNQELKRLEADNVDQADQQDLDRLQKVVTSLREYQHKIKIAESELKPTEIILDALKGDLEILRELTVELKEKEKEQSAGHGNLKIYRKKKEVLDSQKLHAEEFVSQCEERANQAEQELAKAKEIHSLANDSLEYVGLKQRLDKAQSIEDRRKKNLTVANSILITDKLMEHIQNAHLELELAKNTIQKSSTRLQFQFKKGSAEGITIDGKSLEKESHMMAIISKTSIGIPERGMMTITPAVQNQNQMLTAIAAAQKEYDSALNEANVESVGEARSFNERRKALLQDVEAAQREINVLLPEGIDAARDQFVQMESSQKARMDKLELDAMPPLTKAEEWVRQATIVVEKGRPDLEQRTDELRQVKAKLNAIQLELAKLESHESSLRDYIDGIKTKIKVRTEKMSESEIEEQIKRQTENKKKQEKTIQKLIDEQPEEDLNVILSRIERLQEKIRNRQRKRQQLREEKNRLIGSIESLEGAGVDEEIEQKKRELQQVQAECDRIEQEVKVLQLLLDTLKETEQAAKEVFLSPIKERINPYLKQLFPEAELIVNEDMEIEAIERKFNESFQTLSLGTQEQIAVLVRLIFAEILAEQGRPATVILDDALVFSDENRLKTMFDILHASSRKMQIIILTCRESIFEELGGNVLALKKIGIEEFQVD